MASVAPEMDELYRLVEKVAISEASVVIRGESGTGKELVAKALHDLSGRSDGPFRAINCATLTPDLLESELFGHVKGAFTGAIRDRKGLFELADKGTVFLDEVAEIPLSIQARLLRVLQEQTFVPVGGTQPISVDVRVISATHQSLREAVQAKKFRADLMYRIRVVPLFLPRLAERTGDVIALMWEFVHEFNSLGRRTVTEVDGEALDLLRTYDWPGNVRELRNVLEYAYAIGEREVLTVDELTPEIRGEPPPISGEPQTADELERKQLMDALRQSGGRKGDAADLLGISRSTLWRRLREHGID